MQVSELRYFTAAIAEPNLTRLAEQLHISQPALSRGLRRVEAAVGVELFDRVGRTITPNRYGRALAERLTESLDTLDLGIEEVRAAADPERGEVRLAFLHTLGSWLIPPLIGRYQARHPQTRIHLFQASAGVGLEQLLAGRQDLLVTGGRPEDPAIETIGLFTQPLVLAVPPGHALAEQETVWLKDVAEEPFIALSPDTGLRGQIDALCARAGFAPRVAFESQEVETLRGFVAAGLGVALLPDSPAAPGLTPQLRLHDEGAEREIVLAWHSERYRSPAVRAFGEFLLTRIIRQQRLGYDAASADSFG